MLLEAKPAGDFPRLVLAGERAECWATGTQTAPQSRPGPPPPSPNKSVVFAKKGEPLYVALHPSMHVPNFVFAPAGYTMRTADPSSIALRRVDSTAEGGPRPSLRLVPRALFSRWVNLLSHPFSGLCPPSRRALTRAVHIVASQSCQSGAWRFCHLNIAPLGHRKNLWENQLKPTARVR